MMPCGDECVQHQVHSSAQRLERLCAECTSTAATIGSFLDVETEHGSRSVGPAGWPAKSTGRLPESTDLTSRSARRLDPTQNMDSISNGDKILKPTLFQIPC